MLHRQLIISLALCLLMFEGEAWATDWPMFRGPGGSSVAKGEQPPLEWSVADGKNIAWQIELPGRGVSGPIVVAGKVILTASSGPTRNRLHVLAFDARSGKRLWHRQFWATGRTLCHETSAVAAPTPASDGTRIFAYFSSNDIIALDLDGNLLWMRGLAMDFPGAGNDIGLASSPVIAGDVVVVQCEAQGNAFVAAMDVRDGATRWDAKRSEISNWASPIAFTQSRLGKQIEAVLLQSAQSLSAHRADTGKMLWELPIECDTMPSSVIDRYLFVPAAGLNVFDISKQSDLLAGPVWKESKLKSGSPSPVVIGENVYVLNSAGVLICGSLDSKKIIWRKRLGGSFWATPVAVGKYLYCINSQGQSYVVQIDKKGKIVSQCDFEEDILASPAVADGGLFVRSHQHLWKIAN